MSKSIKKTYRVRNWNDYNRSLKDRGKLSIWIPENIYSTWYGTGRDTYSDTAIEFCLVMSILFRLPLRQTQGFVADLFQQAGIYVDVPDYTTMCRRRRTIVIDIPIQDKEAISLILDSTGLKVHGEGEWKVRQHKYSYRRTWRKLHIGIDADGEVRAVSVTHSSAHDCQAVDSVMSQVSADRVTDFYGDGAYDTTPTYMLLQAHDIENIHIPPRRDAKIQRHGNTKGVPWPRDENLRAIRLSTRKRWKQESGYHLRSLGETAMYRFKTIFGDTLSTRTEPAHLTDVRLKCKILNTFTHRGMPDGVIVPT